MSYTNQDRLDWLLASHHNSATVENIDRAMRADGYKVGSDLLPPEKDPYAATRTGPVNRNSQGVAT